MKKINFVIIFLFLLMFGQDSYGQTMDNNTRKELEMRVKQKIEDFQLYLGIMGSRKTSSTQKNTAVSNAKELFIGKCEKYYYHDLDVKGNKIGQQKLHDAVTMQTSVRGRKRPPKPMKDYFTELCNKQAYTELIIESADAVRVDNLQQTAPGRYEGVAYYYQKYSGYRDKQLVYQDKDWKKVHIYVEAVNIPSPSGSRKIWKVMLGDVSVLQTSY